MPGSTTLRFLLQHRPAHPGLPRTGTISYCYDAEGKELWHTTRCTRLGPALDHSGRPTEIQEKLVTVSCAGSALHAAQTIEYLPFGPAVSMAHGSLNEVFGYDQRYRMTS